MHKISNKTTCCQTGFPDRAPSEQVSTLYTKPAKKSIIFLLPIDAAYVLDKKRFYNKSWGKQSAIAAQSAAMARLFGEGCAQSAPRARFAARTIRPGPAIKFPLHFSVKLMKGLPQLLTKSLYFNSAVLTCSTGSMPNTS